MFALNWSTVDLILNLDPARDQRVGMDDTPMSEMEIRFENFLESDTLLTLHLCKVNFQCITKFVIQVTLQNVMDLVQCSLH